MANETKRLRPAQVDEDESVFEALQTMAGYAPANPSYTVEAVRTAHAAMQSARAAETQAAAASAAAKDTAVASEWEFHNLILGVKDQVTAQFGRDSNQVQAVKLKKASERAAPRRRSSKGSGEGEGSK